MKLEDKSSIKLTLEYPGQFFKNSNTLCYLIEMISFLTVTILIIPKMQYEGKFFSNLFI